MHHFHKILEYGSLLLIALILILAGSLLWNFQSTRADVSNGYQLMGWIWSPNYSWISLNSANCMGNSSCGSVSPNSYAVVMSSNTDEIYGWGWSSYVGWVCFGSTCLRDSNHICNYQTGCNPDTFGTFIPSGGWKISVNSGVLSGWAKILSMGDDGLISFNGASTSPSSGAYLPTCYNCTPHCETFRTSTAGTQECIAVSSSTYDNCKICFATDYFNGTSTPPGTLSETVPGGSGSTSFNCKGRDTGNGPGLCTTMGSDIAKRIICDGNCSSTNSFGSGVNSNDGTLMGWSWNGNADRNIGGGWFHLNTNFGNAGILFPWLETDYGSIYSQKNVRQRSAFGRANATYCIFANNIYGVKSGDCSTQGNVSGIDLNFPTASSTNVYRNALGKLDVKGLENNLACKGGLCYNYNYNKYGNTIVTTTDTLSESFSLDNKVYKSTGDLRIGSGLQFKNGAQYGNGTIIVNGNLYIDSNFSYESANNIADLNLNKLASVAWIVKGDVIIGSNVTSTVGAFIVLGNSNSSCQYSDGTPCSSVVDYPKYMPNGYGVIFSGSSDKPLTTYGLMVAKAFDFRRTYADPVQGSERIIYDGRIIANPPPGFSGFVEGLPVMKDF